ncbi:peptidoglycan-associated lipoprotein Pal [Thermodesulfobacteriota bacterium]
MRKKFWISLALLLVVPGLLFTVSCAKKAVKSEVSVSQLAKEEAAPQAEAAEKAQQEERERQTESERLSALEEERIRDQRLSEQRLSEQRLSEQRLSEQRRKEEAAMKAQALAAAAKKMFEKEDIYYDFDSSVLKTDAQDVLKRKAEWLRNNPNVSAIIEGHCDERGTNAYNLALGDRRAESARAFLVDLGISASRLSTISYGEERPVSQGHFEGAWKWNRRAHFVID